MGKYDDIINLPRPVSNNHKQMSIYDRSAQFAPFAALVGYDESISEASRTVEDKIELTSDKIEEISEALYKLSQRQKGENKALLTYFKKDKTKSGGKYFSKEIYVKKVDVNKKILILEGDEKVGFEDIIDINLC